MTDDMKWFTATWARDEGDDAAMQAEYDQHARDLAQRAPIPVAQLISQQDHRLRLDDAIITKAAARPGRIVEFDVLQGDLLVGYGHLRLTFHGATLAYVPSAIGKRPEIQYVEFDAAGPDMFALRASLWPNGGVAIEFTDLTWSWEPKPGRSI